MDARKEHLDAKIVRLSSHLVIIEEKLASQNLSEDKARALRWRLAHLQNKIATVTWKKENLQQDQEKPDQEKPDQEAQTPDQPPTNASDENKAEASVPDEQSCHQRTRGGCGRGRGHCSGRGRAGGNWRTKHEALLSTPEGQQASAQMLQCRAELQAARRAHDQKEVQAKWEACQQAKANWREVKKAAGVHNKH